MKHPVVVAVDYHDSTVRRDGFPEYSDLKMKPAGNWNKICVVGLHLIGGV